MNNKTKIVKNYLKTIDFKNPDWIPCSVGIMPATWKKYRKDMEKIILNHKKLFPSYIKGNIDFDYVGDKRYQKGKFTDNWGCVWDNIVEGLDGAVVEHPLIDWDDFNNYQLPDPINEGSGWGPPPDWDKVVRDIKEAKKNGKLACGGLEHGSMYMRLYYLRGFENFMIDIAMDDHRLSKLIEMVLNYNIKLINKYLDLGVEFMSFADDLGLQDSLAISSEKFRKYLKPCYKKMYGLCKDKGVYVYQHSDGHILEIITDLIESGLDVINPQFRANGLDGLEKVAKGKVCIDLDLDRQRLPFATPNEIKDHIKEAVSRLNTKNGGLMIYAEFEPDIPLENAEAVCETLEEIGGPSI